MRCARNCEKMKSKIIITVCLVFFEFSSAQLNGEFWWLNDKVKQLKGVEPPTPQFEELGEFDTDESSKIIFRDEELSSAENLIGKHTNINVTQNNLQETTGNTKPDNNKLHEPSDELIQQNNLTQTEMLIPVNNNNVSSQDLFVFKFPEDDYFTKTMEHKQPIENKALPSNNVQFFNTVSTPKVPTASFKDMNTFKFPDDDYNIWTDRHSITKEDTGSHNEYNEKFTNINRSPKRHYHSNDNLCTYMKKSTCYERNGVTYLPKTSKHVQSLRRVCCILPLYTENKNRIVFPDSAIRTSKRYKRSTIEVKNLNQRELLLLKKFGRPSVRTTAAINTKIVTPDDDYVDPYWNIKTSNIKFPNTQSAPKADCNYHDYVEDYAAELPTPGLLGIYSDHGPRPPSWVNFNEPKPKPSYGSSFDYSYEDEGIDFGYSTIDPRKGANKGAKRGKPIKLTTALPEEDSGFDSERQTVSFPSNPNFQVLQGFKLLNLARNKNKFYTRNIKRSTTEANVEGGSAESVKFEEVTDGVISTQIYKECGNTFATYDSDLSGYTRAEIGVAEIGSHPWLAVVTSSRKPQIILCYATIVHPRVAITAGDCVSDYVKQVSSSKDTIVVTAGMNNPFNGSQAQSRKPTLQLHPQWRQDNLAHNLAMLHWNRPLRLSANVQPACLTSSVENDDCKFYGWGGFDQAIRQNALWQRASIISSDECSDHLSENIKLPNDAFCATVKSRGTVTGLGGSLVCYIEGRAFSAGVAVYRDNALVLIPAHEWILLAMSDLNLD